MRGREQTYRPQEDIVNVSQHIIQTLADHGVRRVYGIPGDAVNHVVDAIRKEDRIQFIQVRHEAAGALAASAEAKLTGRLAVCVGTAGPGALNLLNGLFDAKLDHAPVLALTGQVPRSDLGTGAHQEVDLHSTFQAVAEVNETLVDPGQLPDVLSAAIRVATSRKCVAHLGIPEDIASMSAPSLADEDTAPALVEQVAPPEQLDEAARLLDDAERVVILAGIGALGARDQLLEVASKLQAPIIKSLRAKELIPDDHPLCLGGLGLLGSKPAVDAIDQCTALLMVGTDFPYEGFYPDNARVVQIESSPERISRRTELAIGLLGQAAPTLEALGVRLASRGESGFTQDRQAAMRAWISGLESEETDDTLPMRPQRVARTVADHAPADAIFACDTGAVTVWAARHLRMRRGQRFVLSGNLGTMGFGISGAIGAQLAYPDRPVIALAGDGGLSMYLGEIATAAKHELPLTIVVFNNGKLGLIQMEQQAEGLPEHQTQLPDIDFAAVAVACGADGHRAETPDELERALRSSLTSSRPSVIDVSVEPGEKTMPPEIEWRHALRFGLAKIRETLGQGTP